MGQQAARSGGGQPDINAEALRLSELLRKCDGLLNNPEQLQRECDFHFDRAGLDAQGSMRRVELRRLLWTFANQLGSSELTWEMLEATAVIGTLEPHVPIVQRDEFFRCVLKTVHLVAAELRGKLNELEDCVQMMKQHEEERALREHQLQQEEYAAQAEQAENPGPSHDELDGRGAHGVGGDSSDSDALVSGGHHEVPASGILFRGAPGACQEDTAGVNGMIALVLSGEGSFEPQRLYVGRGSLILSDPETNGPTFAQRLLCADGRTAFDLSEAVPEASACGAAVLRLPGAALLPYFAKHNQEAVDRMLMLSFITGDAVCIWFNAIEDCHVCWQAIQAECGVDYSPSY